MGSLYGYEVVSEIPLRRLNRAAGTRGAIEVVASGAVPPAAADDPVATLESDDGRLVHASYETESGSLLQMPPTGFFDLDPGRSRVTAIREDDDDELFEHRLASSAICTYLAICGDLALHAAAVEVDGRAMIVCGPSWAGKSTLARTLGAAGHPVIGEDGIIIAVDGDPIVHPGPRGVRVRSGGKDDWTVGLAPDPGPAEPGPLPVGSVVLLGERGTGLEVEQLEPVLALTRLTPTLIHDGTHDGIAAAFSRLARLLHTVPGLQVSFPDELSALPTAARELLDSLPGSG